MPTGGLPARDLCQEGLTPLTSVSTSELPPRQIALEIEVEQERVDRAIDQAYRRIAGRVNVPGFRKGKAPRAMVERVVGTPSIVEDALEHLVPDIVNEVIEEQKIEAYGRPRVDSVDMNPLRVKAVVPLAPKVELGPYATDLRITAEQVQVGPAEIDAVVERLRGSHAQWVPVERPVLKGDRIGLDVRGEMLDGKTVVDSKDAEYVVDAEGPQPAPGFAEQLLALPPGGDRSFTLTLPEDYTDKELAGRPAVWSVKVHWVKERQLPPIDDALAQQLGEYQTVDELRSAVENQLREREEQRVRQANEAAALDKLVEISSVEIPPQAIDHQAQHLLEGLAANLEQQGLKLEQYLRFTNQDADTLRSELRGDAEKRVRRTLALDAFTEAEGITVDPLEVEAEVRKAAAATETPDKAEMAALGSPETMQRIESVLREQKSLGHLVELAARNGGAAGSDASGGAERPTNADDAPAGTVEKSAADEDESANTDEAAPKARTTKRSQENS